jgi:hypothetical protein
LIDNAVSGFKATVEKSNSDSNEEIYLTCDLFERAVIAAGVWEVKIELINDQNDRELLHSQHFLVLPDKKSLLDTNSFIDNISMFWSFDSVCSHGNGAENFKTKCQNDAEWSSYHSDLKSDFFTPIVATIEN